MTRPFDPAFQDWTDLAFNADILEVAKRHGAVMKKAGNEFKGPCPTCGGKDRFSCSSVRNKWFCRGAQIGGMGSISMIQHIAGLPFKAAVESITGIPCPSGGPARSLSETEKAERNRQRIKMEEATRRREAQEAQYQEDTKAGAIRVLKATVPMVGSDCTYLDQRGLKITDERWFDSVRFHRGLTYMLDGKLQSYPCMISRVQDLEGNTIAIQSVHLNPQTFKKAAVTPCKVTMGPCGGGAVRLGGVAPHIYVCEGVETGIAISLLTNFKAPVWCTLGTSGLVGLEVPLSVSKITIWPDGDKPYRKHAGEFVPAVPAGRVAALALQERQKREGVGCIIAAEPSHSLDYADLYLAHSRETA